MSSSSVVSPEWEQWIVDNIARDVPLAKLIEEMVRKNFDLGTATSAVMRYAPESVLAESTEFGMLTMRAYKYPVPTGFEAHYDDFHYSDEALEVDNIVNIDGHRVRVLGRMREPQIIIYGNILSPEECDQLIGFSKPKLKPSTIVENETGEEKVIGERTSEGAFFHREENAFVRKIEMRLAKLMGWPLENGEGIQILHYVAGAEYRPHYDFFAPEYPGGAVHMQKGGQRVATLIMYLNDVESGGETIFPEIDFSVTPRKGGAVFFSYCDAAGKLDRLTLHGGAPVKRGEKWIATKWVRQKAYQ
jgi:prolyl 4-hydroxylase